MPEESWGEEAVRLGRFFGVFIVMALWEVASSGRKLSESEFRCWFVNLGIIFFNKEFRNQNELRFLDFIILPFHGKMEQSSY